MIEMDLKWGNSSIKQTSGRMLAFTTKVEGFLAPGHREERLNVQEMTQRIVINDDDRLKFIVDFLHGNKESCPEMCGAVCGVLFRNGELRKVIDFLGLEDSEDEIYWDS